MTRRCPVLITPSPGAAQRRRNLQHRRFDKAGMWTASLTNTARADHHFLPDLPSVARTDGCHADAARNQFVAGLLDRFEKPDVGDRPGYLRMYGVPVVITHGTLIEGSIDHGGIQPHYVVDLTHPALDAFLSKMKELRSATNDDARIISCVKAAVRNALPGVDYKEPAYRELLAAARARSSNLSLGDYLVAKAGVCREYALLTHLGLSAAGVASRFAYISAFGSFGREDHAIVLVETPNGKTPHKIVDSYNRDWDGVLWEQIADPKRRGRRAELNPYPNIWLALR